MMGLYEVTFDISNSFAGVVKKKLIGKRIMKENLSGELGFFKKGIE